VYTNSRYKIPSGPKMLPCEICPMTTVCSRNMNSTLALDITNHLRYRVLRRNRYQHVDDTTIFLEQTKGDKMGGRVGKRTWENSFPMKVEFHIEKLWFHNFLFPKDNMR